MADADPALPGVAGRVRAARARLGMTRKRLSSASRTSERYLAYIEGGAGNPTIGLLCALAAALDVAPAELLPLGGERDAARAEAAAALRRLPGHRVANALLWLRQESREQLKGRRVVLLGLRGAGKSSLGQALADCLGYRFIEMSREVARLYGGAIGLLIEIGGQSALRRYEHQVWEGILASPEPAVIATPGRIVADASLYERILGTSHTIWLEATPADHMARVMAQGDYRPTESHRAPMEDLRSILEARSADYERADWRLDTSAQSFDATLNSLVGLARASVATHLHDKTSRSGGA